MASVIKPILIHGRKNKSMTLIDKLSSIDSPSLTPLKSGSDKTIGDFWNDFVVPLLPDKK